uniref:Uncharacterized protein n=1 Tax=Branchiostoma floridae TaxID=7739 RepID=C3YVV9_BRAFL|eukprot:XP_002599631.1 hypothetical protein BRAFLDRAFT_102570 [Branchiostoma floridae]
MDNAAVLLLSELYGTLKGGISSIYRRLAKILKEDEQAIPVLSTVLEATEEDEEDARRDGVELLLPKVESGDPRINPSLDWLTFDHRVKYSHLPSKVKTIVGHTDGTSRAACRIKQDRYPEATVILFIDDIPEDTEQYKGDEKAMGIGKKEDSILEDAEQADVVFSIGERAFDHFSNQFRAIPANKRPRHMTFLPRPSTMFEEANAEYTDAETMVVLSIVRGADVEKLGGLDLAVEALSIVAEKMRVKWRIIVVNNDDLHLARAIRDHSKSANLQITFLPYGTQKDICKNLLKAHLVLMPPRAEPFGLVGLEAIAAGVPVLVPDKSGLAELINRFAPHHHSCIVETTVGWDWQINVNHWATRIERALRHCKAEFEIAARLKKTLLCSEYWKESERQFIDVCRPKGSEPEEADRSPEGEEVHETIPALKPASDTPGGEITEPKHIHTMALREKVKIRLANILHDKPGQDFNVLVVGMPGSGKSSFINSMVMAVTGTWKEVAHCRGSLCGNVTEHLDPYVMFDDNCKEVDEPHPIPGYKKNVVFWKCPGFRDEEAYTTTVSLTLDGRIPPGTLVYECMDQIPEELKRRFGKVNRIITFDRIVFIFSACRRFPNSLATAVKSGGQQVHGVPIFVVMTKVDNIPSQHYDDHVQQRIQDAKTAFKFLDNQARFKTTSLYLDSKSSTTVQELAIHLHRKFDLNMSDA